MDTSNSQDECYYSDLDESFSFTCCDINGHAGAGAGVEDDDDESYIEIELEPLPTKGDGDLKLRVSFSSSRVPLKELFVDDHQVSTHQMFVSSDASSSSLSSSSSSEIRGPELISSGLSGTNPKGTNSMRRMQFSAINRVLNAFVSSFRVPPSSEETGQIDGNRRLARRKASKVTTAINGSITKIMIKFRAMKILPALTSIVKARQVKAGNKGKSQEMMISTNSIRIHQKLLDSPTVRDGGGDGDGGRKRTKSLGGLDINMEAIRGILEAISSMSKQTKTKSCPGSIKCSPINNIEIRGSRGGYSRENSVQAAIAHCKRSFGQPHEFCF